MAADKETRCLLLVKLNPYTLDRLARVVPELQRQLEKMCQEAPELAFRSDARDVFGYFVKGRLKPGQYIARLESPGRGAAMGDEPFLTNSDAIFAIELGEDLSATPGFTRAATWLQRH